MDSMKRHRDVTLADGLPRLEGYQYATGKEQRSVADSYRENEVMDQSRNATQMWMCLGVKVKSDAINKILESGMLSS